MPSQNSTPSPASPAAFNCGSRNAPASAASSPSAPASAAPSSTPSPASFNRDSRDYWNHRAATFTRTATCDYELWLMHLLALDPADTLLDMGCATGTLAVPLARAGHRVHACDFAEAMLAILNQRATQESLPITPHLLAWDDDWQAAGLGKNSVDVAFASRSLMAADVQPYICKLDLAARVKAAVVVPGGSLPSADPQLLAYLGRPTAPPRAVESVKRVLADLGRVPVLSTTTTLRPMRFASFEEGLANLRRLAGPEPFSAQEQELFDAYAVEHFQQVPGAMPTKQDWHKPQSERPQKQSADSFGAEAENHWMLDYDLPVTWKFIGWRTDGSTWR
ncbi:class I SAM-dependent methyltransferase [Actinomyces graevenitzii]|uniref:class I SAM-dependent methyltransferase n=1 Tax=Actinomyces graevenitzii TaxID=55565 RepID=UPI000C7FA34D|nr:class I SAM-dependent methyltransferase [Actinomyces graevenitzii]PMC91312.1 class I SAM-dependent methyltransferase [Actinomyces graevenitzii]